MTRILTWVAVGAVGWISAAALWLLGAWGLALLAIAAALLRGTRDR